MKKQIITLKSDYDNSDRSIIILSPTDADNDMPLVIVPHAANFSAADTSDYWSHIITRKKIIAAFPLGHGRVDDMCSFGWREQISDMAQIPETLANDGCKIDFEKIFAVGISMGGQESLLLAGMYPEIISGVAAFNPIADLSKIYLRGGVPSSVISNEMGGEPDEIPDEYDLRSPISFYATISQVPTLIYWDPNDNMIPQQTELHSGKLHDIIKNKYPNSKITGKKHKYGHFWINPGQAVKWLMENHRK